MKRLDPGCYFGAIVARKRVGAFLLTESTYSAGARLPAHSHVNPYFSFVLQGGYEEHHSRGERHCGPRSLVFHPGDETHRDVFGGCNVRLFRLEIDAAWLATLREQGLELHESREFAAGPTVALASRLQREIGETDCSAALASEGLALEMIAAAAKSDRTRTHVQPPAWLDELRDLLHSAATRHVSLNELALAVGVHPVHAARAFRRHFHCTIGEYVRRLRVQRARAMLAGADASLAEIALACGFASQSHFSAIFRRHVGCTPSAYRRSVGGR